MTKLRFRLLLLLPTLLWAGSGGKPALIFVSQRMFADDVFVAVSNRLELDGFQYRVASQDTVPAVGMDLTILGSEIRLADAAASDFSALILVGGSGIATSWQDSLMHARLREFVSAGRVVGSVGIAGICLANAGILQGIRATTVPDRQAVALLRAGGARYVPKPVVTDRNIVTASDHTQARFFARALVRLLKQKKQDK